MSDASDLREQVQELVRASKACSENEVQATYRIAMATRAFLHQDALQHVRDNPHAPRLVAWMCDGWSGPTCSRAQLKSAAGVSTTRHGKCRREYLLEHAFLRLRDHDGGCFFTLLPGEARPMTKGRGAWNVFSARREFLEPLQSIERSGVCITWTVLDGALYSAAKRHFRAEHLLKYNVGRALASPETNGADFGTAEGGGV